jgi:hypothetical protein
MSRELQYAPLSRVHWVVLFYLVCEAIGTTATPGLLCQPRVIVKMILEKQMKCRMAGETEDLGENTPQRHFCPSQNPTWPDLGLNPGRRGGKPATNRLRYGAASLSSYCCSVDKIKMPNNVMHKLLISNFTKTLYNGDTTEKLYLFKCKIDRTTRLKYG